MDIKLYYEESGNGIAFVMLHGNNGNSSVESPSMTIYNKITCSAG